MTTGRPPSLLAIIVVLIIVLIDQGPAHAQYTCPARCRSCNNYIAECAKSSLTAPPEFYPPGTRIINLQDNHIRVIGSRSFERLDSVEVLKMSDNKITSLRSDAFSNFPNLMTLDLTNNRLTHIHRHALRDMNKLRSLSLNRNRIQSLSRIFESVPNLYQLNLAKNKIEDIGEDDFSAMTRVHYIDLRENRISSIHGRAFSQLQNLRYLFLNNNPLASLPHLEFASTVLQLVDLSHCELTAVPGPFPASVTDFRIGHNAIMRVNHTDFLNITDLQLLALNNNELHFLADGTLRHLTKLDEVWLRGNKLVYIPRDLPPSVRKMHMDSNDIQSIEPNIFNNNSRLDYLTVENNQINRILPNTFTGLRFLNTVNFQGNRIDVLERDTFADLPLSTLLLSNNPLRRMEFQAFRNLGNLTQLFLSYIVEENFELVASFLPEVPNLQGLHLMNSPGLVDDIMAMIDDPALNLRPLNSLTHLDLSYNTLEWVSPRIRQVFPNLLSIPLDGNPLTCSTRLKWLHDWMVTSDVSFHSYSEIVCEKPSRLKGRTIRDIQDHEWAAEDEVDIGMAGQLSAQSGIGYADIRGGGLPDIGGAGGQRAAGPEGRSPLSAIAPDIRPWPMKARGERSGMGKRSKDEPNERKGKDRRGRKDGKKKNKDGKRRRKDKQGRTKKDKRKRRRPEQTDSKTDSEVKTEEMQQTNGMTVKVRG